MTIGSARKGFCSRKWICALEEAFKVTSIKYA